MKRHSALIILVSRCVFFFIKGKQKLPHVSEGVSPEKLCFRTLRNESFWKDTVSEGFGRLENRKNQASEHFGRSVGEKTGLPNTSEGVILEKLSFRSVRKAKKWQKQSFRSVRNDSFLKMTPPEVFGRSVGRKTKRPKPPETM